MKQERLSMSRRRMQMRMIDRLVSYAIKAPLSGDTFPLHLIIKNLRHDLGMTQAQLARRAGLAQSHVAKIELGMVDLQVSTLQKIFRAMNCEALVLPRFDRKIEEIVSEQARVTAEKKVARVAGSMALEKQLPEGRVIRDLIRIEEKRLKDEHSSEIWEE